MATDDVNTVLRRLDDGSGGTVDAAVSLPAAQRPRHSPLLLLAHGAGASMHHVFLNGVADALARRGVAAARFNFPYMQAGRRAPDRAPVLERCYRAVADRLRDDPEIAAATLLIGGKSLGGRIATQIAAAGYPCDGAIVLGYPLHPAGKPERVRRAHLPDLRIPLLFLQGTRDSLCNLSDLERELLAVPGAVTVHVVDGADHSFHLPKRMRRSAQSVIDEIAAVCSAWIASLKPSGAQRRRSRISHSSR